MSKSENGFSVSHPPSDAAMEKAFATSVTSETLETVSFGDLIKHSDAERSVVIFLRHYHCGECQSYVMQLNDSVKPETLQEKSIQLLFIGSGDAKDIKGYNELTGNHFPLYSSAPNELYATLGMTKRTLTLGERPAYSQRGALSNIFWSLGNMIKMRSFVDLPNASLQGGDFIISKDGKVLYTHRMVNSRSHTEIQDLLEQVGLQVPPT